MSLYRCCGWCSPLFTTWYLPLVCCCGLLVGSLVGWFSGLFVLFGCRCCPAPHRTLRCLDHGCLTHTHTLPHAVLSAYMTVTRAACMPVCVEPRSAALPLPAAAYTHCTFFLFTVGWFGTTLLYTFTATCRGTLPHLDTSLLITFTRMVTLYAPPVGPCRAARVNARRGPLFFVRILHSAVVLVRVFTGSSLLPVMSYRCGATTCRLLPLHLHLPHIQLCAGLFCLDMPCYALLVAFVTLLPSSLRAPCC